MEIRETYYDSKTKQTQTITRILTNEEVERLEKEQVKNKNILTILELKQNLLRTDYLCLKYAEGELTEEEYAPIKAQRKEWRIEINRLEEELNNGSNGE